METRSAHKTRPISGLVAIDGKFLATNLIAAINFETHFKHFKSTNIES